MTSQSPFEGMDPALGRMHEQTFNIALAQALRQRRQAWRDSDNALIYERSGVFQEGQADRPDILVQTPEIYPVVLEVEFGDPAFRDARNRLGKVLIGTTDPIRSAIAIGAPPELRGLSDPQLAERLADPYAVELKYALLSANIRGDEEVEVTVVDTAIHYWPRRPGFVTGNLEDLAVLCEYAAAPPQLVTDTAKSVAAQINNLAEALYRRLEPAVIQEIAHELGQTDLRQGLRMACCIWLTSLRLQNLLAETSEELKGRGLKTLSELRFVSQAGEVILPDDVRVEWGKILAFNYKAVFNAARKVLPLRMPDTVGGDVITRLARRAARITNLRLGNRVDFAGELFPELLSDREETAAHYTLPETAELLSQLAVARLNLSDWAAPPEVAALKIADFACGTGSLLRAAYRHIRSRHDAAGGTGEGLHRRMMEESIVGLDINALAAHMTAAGLSVTELATQYQRTNIAAVSVLGGQAGSLELLDANQIADVTGQTVSAAADDCALPTNIEVPDESQDLVIQNPPYTRAKGGFQPFAIAGINEKDRRRSENRLKNLRDKLRRAGNEMPNGQAGMGADFSALADRKLKPGGVFATVLPLTAAHSESWQGFRKTLEVEYQDLTAVAFVSNAGAMLSAETNMNEMLLIATKRREPKPDSEQARLFCINLSSAPESLSAAFWYAKLFNGIGQPERGSNVIHDTDMGQSIGSWVVQNVTAAGFPWFTVGMQDHYLAHTAAELMAGRLYSIQDRESWALSLDFATLREVVGVGPTHDLIGHPRGGDGRGAFTFDPIRKGPATGNPAIGPTHHLIGHIRGNQSIGAFTFDPIAEGQVVNYPALWSVDSNAQQSILTNPTHEGHPVAEREDLQRQMLAQRSDLFISRNLRMTSQALAAARTPQPAMGGSTWTSLLADAEVKDALAIWLNSTLGLMTRVCYGQTTQAGRSRMQIRGLAGFPVPDFAEDSPAGEQARQVARERYAELVALPLEPVSYAFRDENRHKIDAAALAMVGLGGNTAAAQALAHLRNLWCREPAVHGGSDAIMRALGLRGPRGPAAE